MPARNNPVRKKKARIAEPVRRRASHATAKVASADFETLEFADAAAFRTWLKRNHASSPGIWIKLAKKGSGIASIVHSEAVDGALRWGWIDGQAKSIDERHWLMKFTPRRARSLWSKINRERATALIARGEMQAPGLAEVERAKADGRWDAAYDSPRTSTVPDDLAKALAAKPRAAAKFAMLTAAERFAILWRIQTAKRPDTRARRIEQFVAMLARAR